MNVLRKFTGFICILVVTLSLSAWLGLMMLQATLLDRTTVKGWLEQSGVYGRALTSIAQVGEPGDQDALLPQEAVTAATQRTFPPTYVQQSVEQALDASYDWLEGKKSAITFTVPIQEKRDEFVNNLAAALEPRIASLPECAPGQDNGQCRTRNTTATQMAQEVAARATGGDTFLQKPITEQSFAMASVPQTNGLQAIAKNATILTIIFSLAAILASAAYVFLHADHLRGLRYIGRRITIGGILTLVGGLAMLFFGSSAQLASILGAADPQQVAIFNAMINPLLQVAVPDIGRWLAVLSGILVVIGAALWIIASVWMRRKRARIHQAPLKPVDVIQTMPGPTPPAVEPPAVPDDKEVQRPSK